MKNKTVRTGAEMKKYLPCKQIRVGGFFVVVCFFCFVFMIQIF